MKNSLHNILAFNLLYTFIAVVIVTILPLYMLERGFSVESMGLVMAALPLAFILFRVVFSSIADQIGTRAMFFLSSIASSSGILIYWIANSPLLFAFGRFADGIRDSAFWAVNRTEIFRNSTTKALEQNVVRMLGLRGLADAAGRITVAFGIIYLSFQNMLLALAVISLVMFYLAKDVPKNGSESRRISDGFMRRIFAPRKRSFWVSSIPLALFGMLDNALFLFIFPVYMNKTLGMGYMDIALSIGWLCMLFSLAVFLDFWKRLSFRSSVALVLVFGVLPLMLMSVASESQFLILFSLYALGWGFANSLYEKIIVRATEKHDDVSTEVAVLHTPQKVAEITVLALIGFAAGYLGFVPLFIFAGLALLLYLITAFYAQITLKNGQISA